MAGPGPADGPDERGTAGPAEAEGDLVVYMTSRFPKVTETFVIDEIVELRRRGVPVRVYSLLRSREDVVQPAALELVREARFGDRSPVRLLRSQLTWLRRSPATLLRVWATVLLGNRSSAGEWVKSVVTTAVAADWALELQTLSPRRVHAHWATHPALAAWVAHRLLGLPYGFTAHAHDIYNENGMLREKLEAADLVVTISEFNRRLLRERYGDAASRVQVLHCGVDRSRLAPTPVRPGPLSPARLLCVASLTDYKGHRHLLDAAAALRDRGVAFHCTLVGDGPLRAELEAQSQSLGLTEHVEFAGRRAAPEVRRLLRDCDVFVLPSIVTASGMMEGIPVALMEALASGRPAVVSRLSGIPELVVDNESGLLVPPGDAAALADALERLITEDDLRRRLGEAGPARIADGFDLQENVARLNRLFLRPPEALAR